MYRFVTANVLVSDEGFDKAESLIAKGYRITLPQALTHLTASRVKMNLEIAILVLKCQNKGIAAMIGESWNAINIQ